MTWLQSFTGKRIPLDGSLFPADICLEDIAHGLSNTCRYGGQCDRFYSVAEHSVHVMNRVRELSPDPRLALAALLHDAAEAYLGDVPSPLKALLPQYRALELDFMHVIRLRFGLPGSEHPLIKQADRECLAAERDQVFSRPPPDDWGGGLPAPWPGCRVVGHTPLMSERRFLNAARDLGLK